MITVSIVLALYALGMIASCVAIVVGHKRGAL